MPRIKRFSITSIFFLYALQAFAYKSTDETALLLNFDKNWKIIDSVQTNVISKTIHANDTLGLQLIVDNLRKSSTDPTEFAKDKLKKFKEANKNCKVSPLVKISDKTKPFVAWKFAFQCSQTLRSGIVIYVDADPINFYIFDLSAEAYPQYKRIEVGLTKSLSSIAKICYKPEIEPRDKADYLSYCHNL